MKNAFEALCGERYTGQFEPDADYFGYTILREWSRLLDVRHFEYSFELDLDESIRYVAGFLGKFIEVDARVADKIKHLLADVGEPWVVRNKAVVMWWEPGSQP